jgi:hypothetical protein
MRNYVEFWMITATLGVWNPSTDPPTLLETFIRDEVAEDEETAQEQLDEFIRIFGINEAPWYAKVGDQKSRKAYIKLDKENTIQTLFAITQLSTITDLVYLEGLIVFRSPKATWSHGH